MAHICLVTKLYFRGGEESSWRHNFQAGNWESCFACCRKVLSRNPRRGITFGDIFLILYASPFVGVGSRESPTFRPLKWNCLALQHLWRVNKKTRKKFLIQTTFRMLLEMLMWVGFIFFNFSISELFCWTFALVLRVYSHAFGEFFSELGCFFSLLGSRQILSLLGTIQPHRRDWCKTLSLWGLFPIFFIKCCLWHRWEYIRLLSMAPAHIVL